MGDTPFTATENTKLHEDIFRTLLIWMISIFVIWYCQYHWKRRRLYYYASKLPGPNGLPFIGIGYLIFGNKTSDLFNSWIKLVEKYKNKGVGKTWLGQKLMIIVDDPKSVDIILKSPKALAKDELYKGFESVTGVGLLTLPVQRWKKHRKLLQPAFHKKLLEQFVQVFVKQSETLVNVLKNFSGKGKIDILEIVSRCTLDIICETAMDVKVHAQTSESQVNHWMDRMLEIGFLRIGKIWLRYDLIFNLTSLRTEDNILYAKYRHFTGNILKEKRLAYEQELKNIQEDNEANIDDGNCKRKILLELLLESSYKGNQITDQEVWDEVNTFVGAGSDTTASSLCFALTMLGMHHDIQQKVYEEVMDVLGPTRILGYADLAKLKLTERVIKETLRLFPVAGFIARYLEEDIDLGEGTILPAGSSVAVPIINIQREPELWPDPLRFDPDRFLPEEVEKRHPASYLPFSLGPRNCIGVQYGMMSMKALLANLVRKIKFFTTYKTVEEIDLYLKMLVKPKNGFNVYVEERI